MARPAVRKRIDLVFLDQLRTELLLIRGRLIRNAENFVLRAHVIFRMPVAIEAPGHIQSAGAISERHIRDWAMARGAIFPVDRFAGALRGLHARDREHARYGERECEHMSPEPRHGFLPVWLQLLHGLKWRRSRLRVTP